MIQTNIKGYNSLNIGAGPYEMIPDWLSITIWREKFDDGEIPIKTNNSRVFKHPIYGGDALNLDITKLGLPFDDNSIEYIYTSHMIEHLFPFDARNFFRECFRILKPGGTFRIICPDIDIWLDNFKTDKGLFKQYKDETIEDIYNHRIYNVKDKIQSNTEIFQSMLYGWDHKWMWNFESLSRWLKDEGFTLVEKMNYLDTHVGKFKQLEETIPYKIGSIRQKESLYVECNKEYRLSR